MYTSNMAACNDNDVNDATAPPVLSEYDNVVLWQTYVASSLVMRCFVEAS